MASKVDMSLDDLVKIGGRRKGGGTKRLQNQGKNAGARFTVQNKFGNKQQGSKGSAAKVGDLRDVLSKKNSSNVTDLRSKLKPKALYTSKNAKSAPGTPSSPPNKRRSGGFPKSIASPPIARNDIQQRRSRKSDPGPILKHKDRKSSVSYEEAKKITVTVPGISRPSSEVSPSWR